MKKRPQQPSAPFGDDYLTPFDDALEARRDYISNARKALMSACHARALTALADWHSYYGLHRMEDGNWRFREWLPNAVNAQLIGEFSDWESSSWFELHAVGNGDWEGIFPSQLIRPGQQYQLYVEWEGGSGWRLPSAVRQIHREQQKDGHVIFNAQVCNESEHYPWRHDDFRLSAAPLIYEAHVGIAQQDPRVGTFREFTRRILPRIADGGYNCLQLMALAQHPYYASFGYQVSNFFAVNDLFGSPDDLKELIDSAHGLGVAVFMDIVHSHAVRNELEGLSHFCGDPAQFFHSGARGDHPAWNSRCFDYGKPQVQRFLLSNCRYWIEEFHIDGLRFDGVTSMIYADHGLNRVFTSYQDYFSPNVEWDALAYLAMANEVCHSLGRPIRTVAEEVSGMPGLAAPIADGGTGFDFRLAMGVTDLWFKFLDIPDEFWDMGKLWYELTSHRREEKTISYVECHDQALVGGQTFIFRCIGKAMYDAMDRGSCNMIVERGIALHKIARLLTAATAGGGYLNFMGNEFGHPEWIDFPRAGNNWSYDHARRRWDLCDDQRLRFTELNDFDKALMALLRSHPHFFDQPPEQLWMDYERHILAFQRDGLLFACNLHPGKPVTDYEIPVDGMEYDLVLSTDSKRFGGFENIQEGQRYVAAPSSMGPRAFAVQLYLPPRTALCCRLVKKQLRKRKKSVS